MKRLLFLLILLVSNPAFAGDGTVLKSAARTADANSDLMINSDSPGAHVILDVTDITLGGGSGITLTIQGLDGVSGKYYTALAGAAVNTVTTNIYTVFPGATASANVTANDFMPQSWRVSVDDNTTTTTYSVGVNYMQGE